jgi:hypothetical protein
MSERVMTPEMKCEEAGTHDLTGWQGCPECGSHHSAPTNAWLCPCGEVVERYRGQGDVECYGCGAQYNASGQRLRDDWRGNMSNFDSEIGDMEGYEMQHAGDW